jgi:hypothetical protein
MLSFNHRFEDLAGTVTNGTVSLTVRQIEDAGVLEILQTPGAALGSWQFLGALLDPAVSTFSFLEPLGHAREVKTAVSGLFGRFVARAYATHHLGLTHFVHVRKPPMRLGGMLRGELRRVLGRRGDMPDWVAWGPVPGMAIVEAKGCHDAKGPDAALARAYKQAERGEIRVRGRRAPFKRYAIATRWGFTNPKPSPPMLWVKDPQEEGDLSETDRDGLQVAMARWQAATLLAPLGLAEIAKPLLELVRTPFRDRADTYRRQALEGLSAYSPMFIESDSASPDDLLIGGFVTPAGPLGPVALAAEDRAMLRRLGIRSAFVGIELGALKRAIEGIPEAPWIAPPAETKAAKPETGTATFGRRSGEDGAGSWVVRLDDEQTIVTPLNRAT